MWIQDCVEAENWQSCFQSIEKFSKKRHRLFDEKWMGCFRITTAGFKTELRRRIKASKSCLKTELRKTILSRIDDGRNFMSIGISLLESEAETASDLHRSQTEAAKIAHEMKEMLKKKKTIHELMDVIERVDPECGLREESDRWTKEWDAFVTRMEDSKNCNEDKRDRFLQKLFQKVRNRRVYIPNICFRFNELKEN